MWHNRPHETPRLRLRRDLRPRPRPRGRPGSLRLHPPGRGPGARHHLLPRRQAPPRASARRLRHPLPRGRLRRLQRARHAVLPRRREGAPPADPDCRVRRHAPPRNARGGRRVPPGPPARGDARRDDLRQVLEVPRPRGPPHDPRGEPRHGLRDGGVPARARPRGRLRRGALLRRLQGRPAVRALGPAPRARGRRLGARALRHQRRLAPARDLRGRLRRPRSARPGRASRHPRAQRLGRAA